MTEFAWLADRRQRTPTVTLQQSERGAGACSAAMSHLSSRPLLPRSSAVVSASCRTRPSLAFVSGWRIDRRHLHAVSGGVTVMVKNVCRVVGAAGLEMPPKPHLIQAWCGRSMSTRCHCHGRPVIDIVAARLGRQT